MNQYLLAFTIGSSWLASLPFFYGVSRMNPALYNYSFYNYALLAPVYLGMMTVLAHWIGERYGLGLRERLALVSVIAFVTTFIMIHVLNTFNYDQLEKEGFTPISYFITLFLVYLLVFNVIIYSLSTNL